MPLLLTILGFGNTIFKAVLAWLSRRSVSEIACILLALTALVEFVGLRSEQHQTAKLKQQLIKCSANSKLQRETYITAQAEAKALNEQHVQKVVQHQQRISTDAEARYQADLARLRAESVKRLRSPTAQGSSGATGVSEVPNAAPGTPPEVLSLPPAELLRAQELELQLNALIDWVNAQSAVDPNK